MYTSDIRETDHEGKPVAVSPALLRSVRAADHALREELQGVGLDFSGGWTFRGSEQAALSLSVRIPNSPKTFTVEERFDPLTAESFPYFVVALVLRRASETLRDDNLRLISELYAVGNDLAIAQEVR